MPIIKSNYKVKVNIDRGYPCLKIARHSRTIVLFEAMNIGMCVFAGPLNRIGEYSRSWDEEEFEMFYGDVTISSE